MSDTSVKLLKNVMDDETGQSFYAGQELLLDSSVAGRLLGAGVAEELSYEDATPQPDPVQPVAGSGGATKPARLLSQSEKKEEQPAQKG